MTPESFTVTQIWVHFSRVLRKNCISQRDGLHVVPLPQIDKLIGQGLDLAIQAERGTAMSVSHLSDHYSFEEKCNGRGMTDIDGLSAILATGFRYPSQCAIIIVIATKNYTCVY